MTKRWETIWLVAGTGLCLGLLPLGAIAAILSPMVFDPRSNLLNPAAWIAFLLIISFWMVCIAAPYGAWVARSRKQKQLMWFSLAAPGIWIAAMVAMLSFIGN